MSRLADVDAVALGLPGATKELADDGRPTYSVDGKMFCFHRPWRKDAPFDDVFAFRTPDLESKELLLADPRGIFFTTPHWNGYPAVLLHLPDLRRLKKAELRDLVVDAWLSRAPKKLAREWLASES